MISIIRFFLVYTTGSTIGS